ncbi:carboxymuconolactone decarboxylase [Actinomadura craniellae]|uniref:Carboxymuconolactone decarboxylase n=1 Tax=Actinomadura craniellae TaxID=2231787 RepID=A0A365HDK5_9ACTN|nr:carboxymuconolactone decarboxylase family protein [Actinomadura craniellae]RAY17112.1 carboxymuconolactone decarboxylase [Actinomadura craniellae]
MAIATTDQAFREVMTVDPPEPTTPFDLARRDFVYGHVWRRPGLERRERRLVTLACVAAADSPHPIEEHAYAALNSGDLTLAEMLELVLHFAVYCGWPKASHLEGVIRAQWTRIRQERGEEIAPWPVLDNGTLGLADWDARLARGAQEFAEVNLIGAPAADTPYSHAGIINYVFGHVWQRPGLSRRDRRFITVACVGVSDAPMPIMAHVGSALHSGDISKAEMDELILHFSAYSGFAKGDALRRTADEAWNRSES